MGLVPTNNQEKEIAGRLTRELRDVIQANMPDKFKGLQTDNRALAAQNRDNYLRDEDIELVIIGLALKFTSYEIISMVNSGRQKDGIAPLKNNNLAYYKAKYAELIDEIYTTAALRIGEIYSNADKIVRIARYNEMADALRTHVMNDLATEVDDLSIKKMNTYLRVLDRMNVEMGNVPMAKMIRRGEREPDDEGNIKEGDLTKDQALELVKKAIDEKYKAQLPDAISQVMTFSDYMNCANGEMLGGICVCWNDKMTDNNAGSQCPVQSGKIHKCPKFLNKSLLNNKEWLQRARQDGLTVIRISKLVGCEEWDVDIRNRVAYYLKFHDIIKVTPSRTPVNQDKEESIEDLETNVVEVD